MSTTATMRPAASAPSSGAGAVVPVSCGCRTQFLEAAEQRWRAVYGPQLVALARSLGTFEKGKLVERPEEEQTRGSTRSAA